MDILLKISYRMGTVNQLAIETKVKKKKDNDNPFADCFAEWSFTLAAEMLVSIIWYFIWNILLFIPRMLLRALSNLF
ncbi:hypothetical protein BB776_01585 [Planococcus salinarum]|uniref:Uncharacterized protein n=1 Tax=Planococcus salinarum TaxID=622695 RepID=A0ABX3D159_9BACL|nr:hypothetical protein BB776_01585 [Planococcus salinarum]